MQDKIPRRELAGWVGEPPPRQSGRVSPRRATGPPGLEARLGPARARGWLRRDATVASHAVRTVIVNGAPAFGVLVERTSGVPALDLPAQRALLTTRLPEWPPQVPDPTLIVHPARSTSARVCSRCCCVSCRTCSRCASVKSSARNVRPARSGTLRGHHRASQHCAAQRSHNHKCSQCWEMIWLNHGCYLRFRNYRERGPAIGRSRVMPHETDRSWRFRGVIVKNWWQRSRRPGSPETSRQRHDPVAGPVSGTYPLMPASQDVGCGTPGPHPYAVVRRTRRRGGAGRRPSVLRQTGDQRIAGIEPFLFVDDVVAVEDGAARVAGQAHGDPLGDIRADQGAGGGAATIVEEAGRHPGDLTGRAPRGAPAADRNAVSATPCRRCRTMPRAVGVAVGAFA